MSAAIQASAAPLRFIGHYDVGAEGKFLWEILTQLRGMGIGRYVTRTEWTRKWPKEASYLRIIRARPAMDRWLHRGRLWAEWTHRGHPLGIYEFTDDLNRSDWRLIHRHEEAGYLENKRQMPLIEVPDSFPLPPLQVHLAKKNATKMGKSWTKADERAPLELCVDPQFEMLQRFFKRVNVPEGKESHSIYKEIDPEVYLDLYGRLLPPKVESWALGPAAPTFKFKPPPEAEK